MQSWVLLYCPSHIQSSLYFSGCYWLYSFYFTWLFRPDVKWSTPQLGLHFQWNPFTFSGWRFGSSRTNSLLLCIGPAALCFFLSVCACACVYVFPSSCGSGWGLLTWWEAPGQSPWSPRSPSRLPLSPSPARPAPQCVIFVIACINTSLLRSWILGEPNRDAAKWLWNFQQTNIRAAISAVNDSIFKSVTEKKQLINLPSALSTLSHDG